ncbi:MAG: hypothetical protein AAGB93_00825 [Planctomycetota bacterium]
MNLTTLAASCALVCVLPVSFVAGSSGPGARSGLHGAAEDTTIVIRYDPEAIFLTHDLVAPLCEREVVLKDGSSDVVVGTLALARMESNALQPKGVFVGRVGIRWASDAEVPRERYDEVMESGLYQLRKALGRRLTTPRHRAMTDRKLSLQRTVDELTVSIEQSSRMLLRSEEVAAARDALEKARRLVESTDFERQSARQRLMVGMANMRKTEATYSGAAANLKLAEAEYERKKALVAGRAASELDLQESNRQLTSARSLIDQAEADLEAERARVEQSSAQADLLEQRHHDFSELVAAAQKRVEGLADAPDDRTRLHLELRVELDRSRLAEVGVELQRAMSELEMLTDVTVERW